MIIEIFQIILAFVSFGFGIIPFLLILSANFHLFSVISVLNFDYFWLVLITGKVSRTLSWWCFNPGLAMQEFTRLGLRSVVLTSGTLTPLDSIALELNLYEIYQILLFLDRNLISLL